MFLRMTRGLQMASSCSTYGARIVAVLATALLVGCGHESGSGADGGDVLEVSSGADAADSGDAGDDVDADAGDFASLDVPDAAPLYASEFTLVEVGADVSAPLQLAVQACAGLKNRALGGSVYVQMDADDAKWLDELELVPSEVVDASAFVQRCVAAFPACVRYSYAEQQALLPNILTVAAVVGALPMDVDLDVTCSTVAFDATQEFATRDTPADATRYVFERFGTQTTGLAMLNPGYDTNPESLENPPLNRDMPSTMVDFVFSQKLFVVFLINGCVDPDPEHEVLSDIVNESGWPTPVGVYGYNNSWNIGGYLYEAQTLCLESRNMGAIATETGNLSFFSTRRAPIESPGELKANPPEDVTYDPSKTYVAFVVGDGDNVRFIMTTRGAWIRQRIAQCEGAGDTCAPLTWSISPHLTWMAPDVLEWYYASSRRTGQDSFILPPSGHLYAYPTSLNVADQARFVTATERDARLLGVAGTVHWDWLDSWASAEDEFLPQYARADGAIRGVFPVNVPYMLSAFPWWPKDQFFEVLAGKDGAEVVLFRPREWRGVQGTSNKSETAFFVTPQEMADELGSYPPGTVTWVYMTSDGGLNLDNAFVPMAKLLPAHVQLVGADTAVKLALSAPRK